MTEKYMSLQSKALRIDALESALRNARDKLILYRQAHGGEYVGGVEYVTLIRSIDGALGYEFDGEVK